MPECDGSGICLRQSDSENNYEKDIEVKCNYNCEPIKCPNYLVCKSLNPQWLYYCHKEDLCTGCSTIGSGKLSFCKDIIECPICLEHKIGVKQINCNHFTCVDCFKRCRYGEEREEYPTFPYSENIEEEYAETPDDPKWDTDYPLIKTYIQTLDLINDYYDEKYENEKNLRKCPLCRM